MAGCGPAFDKSAPTVIVYGDSLTVQSETATLSIYRATKQNVVFRARGGTAMCDWISQAMADSKTLHPTKIVIAFTGNTASCAASTYLAKGAAGEAKLYERSLRQMRDIFPTQPIAVLIPPAMHELPNGWFPFNGSPDLVAMYKRVAPELQMTVNTDADDSLTPGHIYREYGPAYPHGSSVEVRLSDGVHLTPAGALWYGAALLDPHPHQPPVPRPTPSAPATPTPNG